MSNASLQSDIPARNSRKSFPHKKFLKSLISTAIDSAATDSILTWMAGVSHNKIEEMKECYYFMYFK